VYKFVIYLYVIHISTVSSYLYYSHFVLHIPVSMSSVYYVLCICRRVLLYFIARICSLNHVLNECPFGLYILGDNPLTSVYIHYYFYVGCC
jgi:hypothetical protein